MRRDLILALLILTAIPMTATGATTYVDLGTAAPPATVGGMAVTAYDESAQASIPDFTVVSNIPGEPGGGDTPVSPSVEKRTVPDSWSSWSHGYTGPVFFLPGVGAPAEGSNAGLIKSAAEGISDLTLTLPAGTTAFYLYVEPNTFDFFDVTVTTDDGTTSGPVSVNGSAGAVGFGFYSDSAAITSIDVTVEPEAGGFAIGEFGLAAGAVPTLPPVGLAILFLALLVGVTVLIVRTSLI